jgi:hypothetical protein
MEGFVSGFLGIVMNILDIVARIAMAMLTACMSPIWRLFDFLQWTLYCCGRYGPYREYRRSARRNNWQSFTSWQSAASCDQVTVQPSAATPSSAVGQLRENASVRSSYLNAQATPKSNMSHFNGGVNGAQATPKPVSEADQLSGIDTRQIRSPKVVDTNKVMDVLTTPKALSFFIKQREPDPKGPQDTQGQQQVVNGQNANAAKMMTRSATASAAVMGPRGMPFRGMNVQRLLGRSSTETMWNIPPNANPKANPNQRPRRMSLQDFRVSVNIGRKSTASTPTAHAILTQRPRLETHAEINEEIVPADSEVEKTSTGDAVSLHQTNREVGFEPWSALNQRVGANETSDQSLLSAPSSARGQLASLTLPDRLSTNTTTMQQRAASTVPQVDRDDAQMHEEEAAAMQAAAETRFTGSTATMSSEASRSTRGSGSASGSGRPFSGSDSEDSRDVNDELITRAIVKAFRNQQLGARRSKSAPMSGGNASSSREQMIPRAIAGLFRSQTRRSLSPTRRTRSHPVCAGTHEAQTPSAADNNTRALRTASATSLPAATPSPRLYATYARSISGHAQPVTPLPRSISRQNLRVDSSLGFAHAIPGPGPPAVSARQAPTVARKRPSGLGLLDTVSTTSRSVVIERGLVDASGMDTSSALNARRLRDGRRRSLQDMRRNVVIGKGVADADTQTTPKSGRNTASNLTVSVDAQESSSPKQEGKSRPSSTKRENVNILRVHAALNAATLPKTPTTLKTPTSINTEPRYFNEGDVAAC